MLPVSRRDLIEQLVSGDAEAPSDEWASSWLQLVLVGERLIALQGIDAVSLRQVAAEAGNANTSAVQYHFGSKEGLVQAIFEHRIPRITQRRRMLLSTAAGSGQLDLRTAVEVWLLPIVEEAEDPQSFYASFLAQLSQHGRGQHPFDRSSPALQRPSRDFFALVASFLEDIPEPLRSNRIAFAAETCIHVAADRERSLQRDPQAVVLPDALFVADLFDTLLGALQAPSSRAAREALAMFGQDFDARLLLP